MPRLTLVVVVNETEGCEDEATRYSKQFAIGNVVAHVASAASHGVWGRRGGHDDIDISRGETDGADTYCTHIHSVARW
jgi:hypothetical protein